MDNSEFDLELFAKLFDAALASNNPSVKKALRNFMLVASLADADNANDTPKGPFSDLLNTVNQLERRLKILEIQNLNHQQTDDIFKKYKDQSQPPWPYNTTTWYGDVVSPYNDATKETFELLGKGKV